MELIKVEKRNMGEGEIQTVSARDLHVFLESKQDFSTWIKNRILQYEFQEKVDFISFESAPQNYGAGNRGIKIEYHLTLDMAKELSMVERNEKGKQARQYFIECERRAKQAPVVPIELSRMDLIKLAYDAEKGRLEEKKKNERLEATAKKNEPKLLSHKVFINSFGLMTLRESAKMLQQKPNLFTKMLRKEKVLYYLNGNNAPRQEYIDRGYFEVKSKLNHEINKTFSQTFVTPKGLDWLRRRFVGCGDILVLHG